MPGSRSGRTGASRPARASTRSAAAAEPATEPARVSTRQLWPLADRVNQAPRTARRVQSYTYTFSKAGSYNFFCQYQYAIGMKGRITVT